MPLPLMVPTTTALAWLTPRSRESVGASVVLAGGCICVVMRWKQQTATIPDDKRDDATDQHVPGEGNRAGQRQHRERQARRALQPLQNRAALPDVQVGGKTNCHSDHGATFIGAAGEHSEQKYSQQGTVCDGSDTDADSDNP